jgi:hypothetical protein
MLKLKNLIIIAYIFFLIPTVLNSQELKKVLILDIKNIEENPDYDYLEASITESVKDIFKERFAYEETSPYEWRKAADKHQIYPDDWFTATAVMYLGQILSQDMVIAGGFTVDQGKVGIPSILTKVHILDISGKKVLQTITIALPADNNIFNGIKEIANHVAESASVSSVDVTALSEFMVSDPEILSIESDGMITGLAVGGVQVTASYNNVTSNELIYTGASSTDCQTFPFTTGTLQYQDNNGSGASAVSQIQGGCGQNWLLVELNSNVIAGDVADTIGNFAGKIFDPSENEAIGFSAALEIISNGGYFRMTIPYLNIGNGGHSVQIQSGTNAGKWLLFHGNLKTSPDWFDPATSGYTPTYLATPMIGLGSRSIYLTSGIHSGKWLILAGNYATTTLLFNEDTNMFEAGPALSGAISIGSEECTFPIYSGSKSGSWLILHGNSATSSSWYHPEGTTSAGPTMTAAVRDGCHGFYITSGTSMGKWLIIHGNNSTGTTYYDEAGDFVSAGPTLTYAAGIGAHSFKLTRGADAGKWLIIAGNGTKNTIILDEANISSPAPGPVLLNNTGSSAHSFTIETGPNADKRFIVHGNSGSLTSIFDETTQTSSAGPALNGNPASGSHKLTQEFMRECG